MSGKARQRKSKLKDNQIIDAIEENDEIFPMPIYKQQKTPDEQRRIMDIVQSRISVIIDSLEGDDNDAGLKRNVATAVKHLKQISAMLE